MIPRILLLGALAGSLATNGCGGKAARTANSNPAVEDLTRPGEPVAPERFVEQGLLTIGPGDFLDLRLLGYPELGGSFLVQPDGRINLMLVGSVMAAGKTAEELDRDLTAAYGAYFRNMDLAVNVNARTRFVYVLGNVSRPGKYEFRPGERVLHGLANAGGMTELAREGSVVLVRYEADGTDHAYQFDYSHMHQRVVPQDLVLHPGDIIFVPKSRFRTVTDFSSALLDVLGRTATTALIVDDLGSRARSLSVAR